MNDQVTAQQRQTLADIRNLGGKHVSPQMVLELVDLIERLAPEETTEAPCSAPD